MDPLDVPKRVISDVSSIPVLDPQVVAIAEKKVKKRKKVGAKDDIDAIFAGL